jgi:SAM-dependent methyltransferase
MAEMTDERESRRTTFDAAADRYDRARPEYPDDLFDELVRRTRLTRGSQVLEVGCGTGKATRPLAARGFRVTCVELGPELAARARTNLTGSGDVEVVQRAFESWEPPDGEAYDAVVAATSWHWIDPDLRYRKAFHLLRPGGHLAFWSAMHVFPDSGDSFFRELQDVYEGIGEGLPTDAFWPRPGELADERAEIEATGLFEDATITQFVWELTYSADQYIDLLNTFSGHLVMAAWQRERLYGEIRRRLSQRPDGLLRRHWGAALHTARRVAVVHSRRNGPSST